MMLAEAVREKLEYEDKHRLERKQKHLKCELERVARWMKDFDNLEAVTFVSEILDDILRLG